MRQYEVIYIVDPDLTDEMLEPILAKYRRIVTEMGGVVLRASKWEYGRRRLAYQIKGRSEGMYLIMNFDGGPTIPAELDRVFKISDDILRHLIVRPVSPYVVPVEPEPVAVVPAPVVEAAPVAAEPASEPETAAEPSPEPDASPAPEGEPAAE